MARAPGAFDLLVPSIQAGFDNNPVVRQQSTRGVLGLSCQLGKRKTNCLTLESCQALAFDYNLKGVHTVGSYLLRVFSAALATTYSHGGPCVDLCGVCEGQGKFVEAA